MSRLLHLSDTHFGTELPAVLSALERLVACVRPDVLVLSGDITQRATAAQFASARDWLARLPVPHRLVIGGNHDIPLFDLAERLRHPYRRLSAAFGAEREPRLDLPDWQVLTLDTSMHEVGHRSAVIRQVVRHKESGAVVAEADVTFVLYSERDKRAIVIDGELRALLERLSARDRAAGPDCK